MVVRAVGSIKSKKQCIKQGKDCSWSILMEKEEFERLKIAYEITLYTP